MLYLIITIVGFIAGGLIGVADHHGFFPAAWYGVAAVWGVCLCVHCSGFDFD